jgi:hypothetical protein
MQFVVTTACGKRLIGRALAADPGIQDALKTKTVVIIAGTTNGYVAEEILRSIDPSIAFDRSAFFRGITMPPGKSTTETGRLPDTSSFRGDVVIRNGTWEQGLTVLDVVDQLKEGDIILKGANALDVQAKRAAILIGHPMAGTIGASLQVITGKRVQLILPVGLEKRISGNLDDLARRLNAPGTSGPRLLPVPGDVFTELDAVQLLTGADAEMTSAGGVHGAEGAVWLAVNGHPEQMDTARRLLNDIGNEPLFE